MVNSINVFIPTNFYVYKTYLGLNPQPIMYINLIIIEDDNKSLNFTNSSNIKNIYKSSNSKNKSVNIDDIIEYFNKNMECNFYNTTILQRNITPKYIPYKAEYVEFHPDYDSISLFIYEMMKQKFKKDSHYILYGIELISADNIKRFNY